MSKHYINEIGTDIILNCGTDISDATSVKIKYTKPDGTTGEWTGAVYNTNYVKYTLASGNLNAGGVWQLQAYVVSPNWTGYGEMVEILVYETFDTVTNELTTISKIKEFLGKTSADESDDILIYKILKRITKEIEKKCNRTFYAATVTEYHRGNGKSELLIRRPPINSITSIHIDSDREWGSDTQIDADDIIISDEEAGKVILDGDVFDKSDDVENVKIVYSGGYSTIPSDLEHNCLKLCACDYIESRRLNNKVEGEKDFDTIRKETWKAILNNYKLVEM